MYWAFEVRITPEGSKLISASEYFILSRGVTAAVDITTDKRRLIGYFFVPIVDVIQNALEARGTGGNYHFAASTDIKLQRRLVCISQKS